MYCNFSTEFCIYFPNDQTRFCEYKKKTGPHLMKDKFKLNPKSKYFPIDPFCADKSCAAIHNILFCVVFRLLLVCLLEMCPYFVVKIERCEREMREL